MDILRTCIASLLCVAAGLLMRSWPGNVPWQLWMPTGLLFAAAVLAFHRHVGSQLLARAVLWSNLILGTVAAHAAWGRERYVGAAIATATGLALLALGRRGLDGDARAKSFVPVAFRATLMAILVMALADAQTLLLFGTLFMTGTRVGHTTGAVSLTLGLVLLAAIAGLFRLRVWGLILDAIACIGLIAATVLGAFDLPGLFKGAFIASAALQLALAVPLVKALFTGARKRPAAIPSRAVWLGTAAVIAAMAVALYPVAERLAG